MDREIVDYYEATDEGGRLDGWSLERLRTEALLRRCLPAPPARILDAGGGPGRYASWLAANGWSVTLLDPVPLHVAQASTAVPGRVEQADARTLPHPAGAFDATLVLGPLYHLVERGDRVATLREACRVTRAGGSVIAAAISRTASLLDGLAHGAITDARFRAIVARDLESGAHRNPAQTEGWFTTAYFHSVHELASEGHDAGLTDVSVVGIEGPAWVFGDRGGEPDDDEWRNAAIWAAELVERDPDFVPLSAHLLLVGRVQRS